MLQGIYDFIKEIFEPLGDYPDWIRRAGGLLLRQ